MKCWWGSALYLTNTLCWIFIVLAHWINSLWIDMSLHSDTLSWFRANQSLLFLLNDACLLEKLQILKTLVWPDQDSNSRSTVLEASLLTITPSMRLLYIYIYVWKLNQTVLEFDFWAVKFLFFPRRDLNSHHWYTAYIVWYIVTISIHTYFLVVHLVCLKIPVIFFLLLIMLMELKPIKN